MGLSLSGTAQPLHSRYHVWVRSVRSHTCIGPGGSRSSHSPGGSEWLWLGVAHSERFHCAVLVCEQPPAQQQQGPQQGSPQAQEQQQPQLGLQPQQQQQQQQLQGLRAGGGPVVCRPHGRAAEVLAGREPAAAPGVCGVEAHELEVAVQPEHAGSGLPLGVLQECSKLRLLGRCHPGGLVSDA